MSNKVIYKNKIKMLGKLAETFRKKGWWYYLDGVPFKITAVGDVAERNLASLGHITVLFNGATQSPLPGTICVEQKKFQI